VGVGIVTGLSLWILHQIYERRTLDRADHYATLRDIKFPREQFEQDKIAASDSKES
jgi:hypothetical protein